jgi:hypothetical protein
MPGCLYGEKVGAIMMKPTIHLNGSSGQELLDNIVDAGRAVQDALTALGKAYPNARDYYPQGNGAYRTALSEHEARCRHLAIVRDELEHLAMDVADEVQP